MKSILVIGNTGQIGSELPDALRPLGHVTAVGRTDMDLIDPDAIRAIIRATKPDIIVNAAAYTAVDKAESEPAAAMQINAVAPGIMAEEAKRLGAALVHYSTDYVFDGTKSSAYTEADKPNPLSIYGKSKLAGEQAIQAVGATHYILRTSWVYSIGGANFMNTILRLARERPELRIVDDQIGAPTWARAIAGITARMLASHNPDHSGLYHVSATGAVTWFGFAQTVLDRAHKSSGIPVPRLVPITTAEYPLPAQRPANSRLDTARLVADFGIRPAPWQNMLQDCLDGARL